MCHLPHIVLIWKMSTEFAFHAVKIFNDLYLFYATKDNKIIKVLNKGKCTWLFKHLWCMDRSFGQLLLANMTILYVPNYSFKLFVPFKIVVHLFYSHCWLRKNSFIHYLSFLCISWTIYWKKSLENLHSHQTKRTVYLTYGLEDAKVWFHQHIHQITLPLISFLSQILHNYSK